MPYHLELEAEDVAHLIGVLNNEVLRERAWHDTYGTWFATVRYRNTIKSILRQLKKLAKEKV